MGEAIPTQQKLRVLADWLQVRSDWLRYGDDGTKLRPYVSTGGISAADSRTFSDLRRLEPNSRKMIDEVIKIVLKAEIKHSETDGEK